MSMRNKCAICDRNMDPYGRDGAMCAECAPEWGLNLSSARQQISEGVTKTPRR